MTATLLFITAIAAVAPARFRLAVRASRVAVLGRVFGGALITLAVVAGVALAGDSILDWLSVRSESWRIAAGIVAGFTGVRRLLSGLPQPEPVLDRVPAALVPVAFPMLITPVVVTVALAGGVDLGVGNTVISFTVALGLAAATAAVPGERTSTLWLGASRFAAAVLIVVAVALIISGIADI
jgi:small neutral amino acid transporter SnatA (MarC family)